MKFSVIVPVYNRLDEINDLLESLRVQTIHNFEVIIVEDGSTHPCEKAVDRYKAAGGDIKYYKKENEGRSIARNHGMERATGDYFVFFDSDCIIPANYFERLEESLKCIYYDFYGGPDAAHASFSDTQKAINHTMTSFLTTGGIRGGKHSLEKFTPRTFNMGFSVEVYRKVGGFREMFSEDIDMSTRIKNAGYTPHLLCQLPVWHKRRISLKKFWRQVHIFGMSRITLMQLYPGSLKPVHILPAAATVVAMAMIVSGIIINPWFFAPLAFYLLALFAESLIKNRSVNVALLTVPAATIQIAGYGTGFIKAYFKAIILRKGRDHDNEIKLRKGN